MAAEGGRIDFMFLGPPLTRPLDPLLRSLHPGGVCIQGVSIWGGLGRPCTSNRILRDTVNERAVRILRECILVLICLFFMTLFPSSCLRYCYFSDTIHENASFFPNSLKVSHHLMFVEIICYVRPDHLADVVTQFSAGSYLSMIQRAWWLHVASIRASSVK